MQRIVTQIRDLDLIEGELKKASIGVLAVQTDEDSFIQQTTTFLYRDKNIYIFFKADDEVYNSIKYDSIANFTIVKPEKIKRNSKKDFVPTYSVLSVTLSGLIRKVDEEKAVNNLRHEYLEKYSKKIDTIRKNITTLANVIMMDSDEIHAQEEIGG